MTQQRRSFTDEEKAEAMRRVLTGETMHAVSDAMDIPYGTLKVWVNRSVTVVTEVVTKSKREEFGELILGYLGTGIASLKTQADVLNDPVFLRSKDGQIFAVAQAHRILGDQIARYLSAVKFDD